MGQDQARTDVDACLSWLGFQPDIRQTALIGFSAGGHLAYLVLYTISSGTANAIAPLWSLALILIGALLGVVAATSLPAWLATQIHPADTLRYE